MRENVLPYEFDSPGCLLEQLTGRRKANFSRTLKTLARYGIVTLDREKNRIVPKVRATDFKVEFGLHSSTPLAA